MKDVYGFEKEAEATSGNEMAHGRHLYTVGPALAGAGAGMGLGAGIGGAISGTRGVRVGAPIGALLGSGAGALAGWHYAPELANAFTPGVQVDPHKTASHDTYGFKKVAVHDAYGFEKRAWGDLDDAAYFHGFNGPSYSDDPGTPVNLSLINPSEGSRVGHGIGGGVLGGLGGAGLGGVIGAPFGPTGALVGMGIGGVAGAVGGGLHGYHNAPKELIMRHGASPVAPQSGQPAPGAPAAEPPKMAHDMYGFATKEALAAPGLLGQMGSAVSRMGKATGIAAQRAGNAFQAERGMSRLTGGQLPNSGLGQSLLSAGQAGVGSLMKSQAGRRVIGTGIGLGAAGTLAAGTAAYNATQPKPPVALAR